MTELDPITVQVAAKLGSPFKVWVCLWGHGRFDRRSGPGCSVQVCVSLEHAKAVMKEVLDGHYESNHGSYEWADAALYTLSEENRVEYDLFIGLRGVWVEAAFLAMGDGEDFEDSGDEIDSYFGIREKEVTA